jgi:hypothetical protein
MEVGDMCATRHTVDDKMDIIYETPAEVMWIGDQDRVIRLR